MKQYLKRLLPKRAREICKVLWYSFSLLPEYWYWFKKDLFESNLIPNERSILAGLMVTSHVLEKGITMPNRRLGFGYDRVRYISRRCKSAIKLYSENHIEIQSTLKDLEQYLHIHIQENFQLPADIEKDIRELLNYKKTDTIACFESTPDKFFKSNADFREFAHSRHTVRWYSGERVDKDVLIEAIRLAQTAPSACNRQSTKVYIVDSGEKKEAVLRLQNGNRGFGHLADKILLVSSNMKFWSYNTRYMAYIDAGIFTQNLLYSLHYYKICACTLNANLSFQQRKELQNIIGYTDSEIPTVFISIGMAPEHFMVAGSQRINTDQIYTFV